jgi:hypothetical protein
MHNLPNYAKVINYLKLKLIMQNFPKYEKLT